MALTKGDNENLDFLYTCFKSAVDNGGKVDLAVVAATHQINVPAASMRLSRLRKVLNARAEKDADNDGDNNATNVTLEDQKAQKSGTKRGTPATKGKKRKFDEVEKGDAGQSEDAGENSTIGSQVKVEEDAEG